MLAGAARGVGRGRWTAAGGRGRAAERKRDGRAPGERPAYSTTALQDTSNLTSVKTHSTEGEEPISW